MRFHYILNPPRINLVMLQTRLNSALGLRRRCTSMCEQSMCKVQIYRNEIRLHPNYTMQSTVVDLTISELSTHKYIIKCV